MSNVRRTAQRLDADETRLRRYLAYHPDPSPHAIRTARSFDDEGVTDEELEALIDELVGEEDDDEEEKDDVAEWWGERR